MRGHHHDPYRSTLLAVPQLPPVPVETPGALRVLAYVDRYPPRVNAGAEWMLHTIMRDLVQRGHECRVATASDDGWSVDGVDVWPAAAAAALAVDCDVMVAHLLWTRQAVELAARAVVPVVYLVHNAEQVGYWTLTPSNVTALVWNSEWVAAKCGPRWRGPAQVCRPPVAVHDYDRPCSPPPAAREFVTLVNVNPEKGASTFYALAGYYQRQERHRRFLAVEGAYGTQIRMPRLANVEWQRPTANMAADVYARTRVLLVPSQYESWGRVAIEAAAAGIPVVAHPTPGLVESLGPAGVFVDRADTAGWVRALDDLDDPDRYEEVSTAVRARAHALWSLSTSTDLPALESLLRRCASITRARQTAQDRPWAPELADPLSYRTPARPRARGRHT